MKAIDLTGQKFGRLIVEYKDYSHTVSGRYLWHCRCECGNETNVRPYDLRAGRTKSCGCLQKEKASEIGKKTVHENFKHELKNISNQRFGKLIALKVDHRETSATFWKCLCDCGNYTIVRLQDLQSGNTSSCGCIRSKGEQKIQQLLYDNNISFVKEKSFENCIYPDTLGNPRFDFYVNNTYLIEYDGIQHFQDNNFFSSTVLEQQKKDIFKNQWCKENNIPLIRIPYTILNNMTIEDLLIDKSKYVI